MKLIVFVAMSLYFSLLIIIVTMATNNESNTASLANKIQKLISKIIDEEFTKIFDEQCIELIKTNIQDFPSEQQPTLKCISQLLQILLGYITTLQQKLASASEVNSEQTKEQYLNLQLLLQKQQAQNRNHIRLENHFKLCVENLEEKIQQIQQKLRFYQDSNIKLLQTISQLEKQNKNLVRNLQMNCEQTKKISSQQSSKIFMYHRGMMSKSSLQKVYDIKKRPDSFEYSHQKHRKMSNKESISKLTEHSIQINLLNDRKKRINTQKCFKGSIQQNEHQNQYKKPRRYSKKVQKPVGLDRKKCQSVLS